MAARRTQRSTSAIPRKNRGYDGTVYLTRHNRYKNVLPLSVFQSLLQKVEDDLGAVKAYGASLTAQRNSLRMVPNLFGVINF